jgi:predicted alpha/beta hydrolase family esterase
MKSNVFIFHGTGGYPEENWFPWLKDKLETKGHKVFVPQFPSPSDAPSSVKEWFEVLKNYEQYINPETILIGHSLGGVFALRVLERLNHKVKVACFTGTPIGVRPILNYDKDMSFSGFDFDWDNIKSKADNFIVFQSDDDPYVSLGNGQELATKLGVELSFVPNAGHFNKKAGYTTFPELLEKLEPLL